MTEKSLLCINFSEAPEYKGLLKRCNASVMLLEGPLQRLFSEARHGSGCWAADARLENFYNQLHTIPSPRKKRLFKPSVTLFEGSLERLSAPDGRVFLE